MVGRKTRQRTWFSGVHHCYVVGISNKLSGDPVVCSFIMISTRLSTLSSLFFSLRSCISLFFIPSHSMALCLPLPCSVSFSVSLWFRASPLPFFPWFSHYVPLFHPLLLNPNNTVPLVYTNDRQHTRVASTRILTRSRAWTRTVSTRCTKLVSLRRPSVQWNRRTSSRFSSHGCCRLVVLRETSLRGDSFIQSNTRTQEVATSTIPHRCMILSTVFLFSHLIARKPCVIRHVPCRWEF